MISFLWRKILKNKWLTLSLLFGNILLIGIVTATPLFTTATMQRIFQEDMRTMQHEENTFPAIIQMGYTFNRERYFCHTEVYNYSRFGIWPEVVEKLNVPNIMSIQAYTMTNIQAIPSTSREDSPITRQFTFAGIEGFESNVQLLHGRLPSPELVDGRIMEIIVSENAMHRGRMMLDELWDIRTGGFGGMQLRVVGVFAMAQDSEAFWSVVPVDISQYLVAHYRLIHQQFAHNYITNYNLTAYFTQALDFSVMHILDVDHYQQAIQAIHERLHEVSLGLTFEVNFTDTMVNFTVRTENLPITLWILQLPLYVMMALYIYMVSRKILEMDKNDIAVLHSRGASRRQIIGMYVYQGLFIGAISFVIGLALGVAICQMMGGSNGFLEMVARESLYVRITGEAMLYGVIAAAFSFMTMLLPVISFSKVNITDHKTSKRNKAVWQRYFLDIICVAAAVYGIYTFNNQQELMAAQMTDTQFVDPLLFFNSSVFILGVSLLCLRLFPYFMKLVFLIGRSFFSPSIYASMLKVMRSAGEEQFIMLFLVFTIAVGIFSAQVARTINLNNDHRILYTGGADITFMESVAIFGRWEDNMPPATDAGWVGPVPRYIVYTEPDFSRFTNFDEVDNITRVMRQTVTLRRGTASILNEVDLIGIDTYSFGNTAWFRYDLLPLHINYFLNSLASVPNGVLLSDNFRTALEYDVGNLVNIRDIWCPVNQPATGTPPSGNFEVIGFVERWPGIPPIQREELPTGEIQMTEPFFAIVNFNHIQTTWGIRPYEVWMQTNTDSSQFFHDFVEEHRIRFYSFFDTNSNLAAIRTDPIVMGMNGILTMSFVTTLLVSFTGFLIYWILSIKSRVLQFGIFRAMGLSMRHIISLLVNEQIFITLTSLVFGGIVGAVGARLFVPIIQVSYTAADQVLPLVRIMEAQDYRNLYGVLIVMIVLCLLVLASFISRIKITQALKLGED